MSYQGYLEPLTGDKIPHFSAAISSRTNADTHIDERQKAALAAQVQGLLMKISTVLSRIASMQATNSSAALSGLAQNYEGLQARASQILYVLSNPDMVNSLSVLSREVSVLSGEFRDNLSDVDKSKLESQTAPSMAALQMAANAHPLVKALNDRTAALNNIMSGNTAFRTHFEDARQGAQEMAMVMAMVAAMNGGRSEESAFDDIIRGMADKAWADEKDRRANGATEEEIVAVRKTVRESIHARAQEIYASASTIRDGMAKGYDAACERILETYEKFVGKHVRSFHESYPAYYTSATKMLGQHAQGWKNDMEISVKLWGDQFKRLRDTLQRKPQEQTVGIDFEAVMNQFRAMDGTCITCGQMLDTHRALLSNELGRVQEARTQLMDALTGRSDETQKAAEVLGMKNTDVIKHVAKFRAANGLCPSTQTIRSLISDINGNWRRFWGKGQGTGRGGPGDSN